MKKATRQCMWTAAAMAALAVWSMMTAAAMAQTRFATGTSEAAVVFGPTTGPVTLESIYAVSDKAGAAVTIHAWDNQRPLSPSAAHAATNIIAVANADGTLAQNDRVVYVHADGTAEYRTLSAATTTNVTLSANLSKAGGTDSRIYKLSAAGSLPFDTTGAAVGTNKFGRFEGSVWRGLAPVRVAVDGTSNTVIQVTGDR